MIKIIKNLFVSLFLNLFFENMTKDNFLRILNYIKTLKVRELFGLLNWIRSDRLTDNNLLRPVFHPFEIDFTLVVNSFPRKIFLFGFIFTLIINVWLTFLKKIILLPFKLGIFSFIYSIFGFDVTWFLNLFNVFTFNIPYWVYFQYLTMYNNWLNWWYKTVDIKSINSIPINEVKKVNNKIKEVTETENPGNNKIKYIVGGILIIGSICSNKNLWYIAGIATVLIGIGFALWYFDVINSTDSGSDSSSSQGELVKQLLGH